MDTAKCSLTSNRLSSCASVTVFSPARRVERKPLARPRPAILSFPAFGPIRGWAVSRPSGVGSCSGHASGVSDRGYMHLPPCLFRARFCFTCEGGSCMDFFRGPPSWVSAELRVGEPRELKELAGIFGPAHLGWLDSLFA